ncbi:MAG: beta-glucosidase [Chitinophagaceae bacterium]|nr:MAG: beta-glucosidase [Chitinophagaceae bacterium]
MKKLINISIVSILIATIGSMQLPASAQTTKKDMPQLGKNSLKEIVNAMTLEQKANLVVGLGMVFHLPPGAKIKFKLPPQNPEAAKVPEKVPGAAGRTYPFPEFGIPSITMSDGPAGVRIPPIRNNDSSKTYYATQFPVETLLASTWDTSVVRKVGEALGSEARNYGVDIMLLPAMDIQRNPLGGRNFEYYSEDPLVSGYISAAMIKGVQDEGVGVSVKHFFANNQETSRNDINEEISERAIREIYLKGFKIAIQQSDPWTVMSSYNLVNGTYTSQSKDLLTTILRDEWGYKGFVMTDWFGGKDPVAQMKAGNDLLMPGTPVQSEKIIAAVKDGSLPVGDLNRNVERIMEGIMKTPGFKHDAFSNHPDLKKDEQISRWAATQGMVLLKDNGNALPLKKASSIALYGYTSYDLLPGGFGSGTVNTSFTVSLNQGLENAGFGVDQTLQTSYENYIAHEKAILPKQTFILQPPAVIPEMAVDVAAIKGAAAQDNVALITIGRNSGEGIDRKEESFYLTQQEKDLIKNVSDVFHAAGKKVVVVLNIAGPIEMAGWSNEVDGILLAWMPGQEAGNAIADVLSGKVNPSGKLAQTFPVHYSDVPSAKYFPGTPVNKPKDVVYGEGIYVGYRYYHTFHIKTAYPFGYGLSYTHFTYSDLKLSTHHFDGKMEVSVTVTNTGEVAGKDVVELYLSAPQKELKKPEEELKAFAKTRELQPGESETMNFVLNSSSLASFNTPKETWIAEAGKYTVKIGASCEDIKQSASFDLAKDLFVEKVHAVLAPQVNIPPMK